MPEFFEEEVDTFDLVEEVLESTFFSLKGEAPEGGSFRPNSVVVKELEELFEDKNDLIEFCRLAIATHVWMCDSGKNVERIPFYCNKHLLAPKRIEQMDQYAHVVRSHYGNKLEHIRGFSQEVYTDVVTNEGDYIYIASAAHMHGDEMRFDYIRPTLYWVLASTIMGRFKGIPKRHGCPEMFCGKVVNFRSKKMFFEEAWALEVDKLRSSNRREEMFLDRACQAFCDVRHDWAVKSGLVQSYRNDFGEVVYKNLSGIITSWLDVMPDTDLKIADHDMFCFAKEWLGKQGTSFSKPSGVRVIEEVEEKVRFSDGVKSLSDKSLDPALMALMDE